MLPRYHGGVSLRTKHAKAKDCATWARNMEIDEEKEQRLQAQATYVTNVRAKKLSTQAKERL